MSENFNKVKNYLLDLDVKITAEDEAEELFVVQDEDRGIQNLVIDCEAPILVIEQLIMDVPAGNKEQFYKRLLELNRSLVHGAFVLDSESGRVLFRDTLQLENLDLNELEATLSALSLALAENANELLEFAKK